MDRLKTVSDRLKTNTSNLSRTLTTKVKDLLSGPTPESKLVDDATSDSLPSPNWSLNLRICAMINAEEVDGAVVVRAIKRRLGRKDGGGAAAAATGQMLCLDLLETVAANCEKGFSEIAAERVVEDMGRMARGEVVDFRVKERVQRLLRVWGEMDELAYLPVFRQVYLSLKASRPHTGSQNGDSPPHHTLESLVNQPHTAPPGSYPIPEMGLQGVDDTTNQYSYTNHSVEGNKEYLMVTRNSLDLLGSILNSGLDPIPIKDELTVSMLEKCKQSLPVVQRIAETTHDDEVMLFEALNLHEELQQVISRYEEINAYQVSVEVGTSEASDADASRELNGTEAKMSNFSLAEDDISDDELQRDFENHGETKRMDALPVQSSSKGEVVGNHTESGNGGYPVGGSSGAVGEIKEAGDSVKEGTDISSIGKGQPN